MAMPSAVFETAGLLGVCIYLGSYGLLQAGVIRGSGYLYASLNLAAAALVLVSLANSFNLSSAIIQISWIAISLIGMTRFFLLNRSIHFTAAEKEFLGRKMPLTPPILARRFFDAGTWLDLPSGQEVMTEGERHGTLLYLAQGTAEIRSGGHPVGTCETGSFLGEMTALYGTPATATVHLTAPARVFRITTEALDRLMARSPDLRILVENSLARDTVGKLTAANRRLSDIGAATG